MKTFIKKHLLQKHYIFSLFIVTMLGIMIGLSQGYNPRYTLYVSTLYLLPCMAFYSLFHFLGVRFGVAAFIQRTSSKLSLQHRVSPQHITLAFVVFIILVIIVHALYVHGFPGYKALMEFKQLRIFSLRKSITSGIPGWLKYVYSFSIKAIIPVGLVYMHLHKRRWPMLIFVLLAFFIGINSMQKSHFLSFFIPLTLLLFYQRQFKKGLLLIAGIFFCIVFMIFVTNPSLKYSAFSPFMSEARERVVKKDVAQGAVNMPQMSLGEANEKAVNSIILRTFYLPGSTVGKWFDAIPRKKPFLHGKGYKLYSSITGKPFHDYGRELYPVLYPHYAKRGFAGSVNVASFMYEYANFGLWGLPLSAFIITLILLGITFIFRGNWTMQILFNTIPVLFLSSGSYTILLFSGGWGLIILLYILLLHPSKTKSSYA